MVSIALIVTGDLEQRGLGPSLQRVFRDADFSVQKVDGFTSAKVLWPPPPSPRGVKSSIEKYATAFLAALDPGRKKPRPDFVFGIEDLELINRQQPQAVIEAFRNALVKEMDNRRQAMNAASFDKFAARVKENCSFHLLAPMPEAYFFADAAALQAVGCARQPLLVPNCDVEQFQTADPAYLAAPARPAPSWAIDAQLRPWHPKHYLRFLLDPAEYSETAEGLRALQAINWQKVLANSQHTLFLRSLFQDLADAVGIDQSQFPGAAHPLTADYRNRDRLLRNL